MKRWMQLEGQAVIVGCGGVGGAIVRHLLERSPGLHVVAASRSVMSPAHPLAQLQNSYPDRLTCKQLDITDTKSLEQLKLSLGPQPLRLVVNASGWLHGSGNLPEKQLQYVSMESLRQSFEVNACGPILLAKIIEPLLPKGAKASDAAVWFGSLSARVGSIGDNQLGGWYSYRAGKAAQNQLLRTLAIEWRRTHKNVCVAILHPGTVATALSSPFSGNVQKDKLFTPEYSADCLLGVLTDLDPVEHSGSYLDWAGKTIPW
eukprot:gb/GEZN01012556.1/.p1 GENE.gb/GEZN01012556.1/~~gb/GEZN01012556.1/.p1  ORF type:complete len:260 (+),score=11.28 gb/GEZN01012556.1/:120-899(+)